MALLHSAPTPKIPYLSHTLMPLTVLCTMFLPSLTTTNSTSLVWAQTLTYCLLLLESHSSVLAAFSPPPPSSSMPQTAQIFVALPAWKARNHYWQLTASICTSSTWLLGWGVEGEEKRAPKSSMGHKALTRAPNQGTKRCSCSDTR